CPPAAVSRPFARPPPASRLFPYTTLFRSPRGHQRDVDTAPMVVDDGAHQAGTVHDERARVLEDPHGIAVHAPWVGALFQLDRGQIGRAHVCTPVTPETRMPSSPCRTKQCT